MTTMEDIRKTAQDAYRVCTGIDNDDIDALFNHKYNNANWFIEKNLDVLNERLEGYDDDEIMEAAETDNLDEAKRIVGDEAQDEFAYLMEAWWDAKLKELKNEATTPKAGMTRVYKVYATDIWCDNEWTKYVGTDYNEAREVAIDEDGHLTRADNKVIVFTYNDYTTETIAHLSDAKIKDLMESADGENQIPERVWHGRT